MIKEIKNFVEKSANNFMEWIFQGEFKKFDESREPKQEYFKIFKFIKTFVT